MYQSRRNLTDEQITAVADSGGVIGVCAFPGFVSASDAELDRLADHVDYLVALVGDEHVGLGLDFAMETEGGLRLLRLRGGHLSATAVDLPAGHRRVRRHPQHRGHGLRGRGYRKDQIERIASGNFLRVFREVWGE